jgi:hypothetical protein
MITRADMADSLSLGSGTATKTFVLEAHADDPVEFLRRIAGSARLEATEDAFLFLMHLDEGTFWVDQLDERFWSLHTDIQTATADRFLSRRVEEHRDLDWMWLPSNHLRHVWPGAVSQRVRTDFRGKGFLSSAETAQDLRVQLAGHEADDILDYLSRNPRYRSTVSFDGIQVAVNDPDVGQVTEGLTRMGRFAVSGDSFELHLQFVSTVVRRYRQLVELCERKAIGWSFFEPTSEREAGDSTGGLMNGGPIAIRFSREIEDLDTFLGELFAVRRPFRLWGIPEVIDGAAHVEAVDLHVGQRMRMDIGTTWMRVYLNQSGCGNSVARLITNLQHWFDSALTLVDPELQAALDAQHTSLGALAS